MYFDRRGNFILVLSAGVLVCGNTASQPAPRQLQGTVIDFPNDNPVELGWGWDQRNSGAIRQSCIDFRESKGNFIDKRLNLQSSNDHDSLSKALNISVAGKMSAMGGGKFSASASFAHNASFVASAEHIAMLAEVSTAPRFVAPINGPDPVVSALERSPDGGAVAMGRFYQGTMVRLKPPLRELAEKKPVEFIKQCGTGFVAVIHEGARVNALLTFRDMEETDRKQIKAAAKGSGGGYSMNASMDSLIEKYRKSQKLEIKFEQRGGSDKALPMEKEALMSSISGLPLEAAAHPRPFTMVVQAYDTLPNWPDKTVLPELSDEEVVTRAYLRLRTLMSYAEQALNDPASFLLKFDTARDDVIKLHDEMLAESKQLRALALQCQQGQCKAEKWMTWSDMPYRARMPMVGGFNSIKYAASNAGLDRIPSLVADRRVSHWIRDADQWRCQYESECMKQGEIEQYKSRIRSKIAKIMGVPDLQ